MFLVRQAQTMLSTWINSFQAPQPHQTTYSLGIDGLASNLIAVIDENTPPGCLDTAVHPCEIRALAGSR